MEIRDCRQDPFKNVFYDTALPDSTSRLSQRHQKEQLSQTTGSK